MTTDRATQPGRCRVRPGPADVFAWRRDQLRAVGCEGSLATRLAFTAGVDLHALLDLVDRGCPVELAVRILGPLDDADPARWDT